MKCAKTSGASVKEAGFGHLSWIMEEIFTAVREGDEVQATRLLDADPKLFGEKGLHAKRAFGSGCRAWPTGCGATIGDRGANGNRKDTAARRPCTGVPKGTRGKERRET